MSLYPQYRSIQVWPRFSIKKGDWYQLCNRWDEYKSPKSFGILGSCPSMEFGIHVMIYFCINWEIVCFWSALTPQIVMHCFVEWVCLDFLLVVGARMTSRRVLLAFTIDTRWLQFTNSLKSNIVKKSYFLSQCCYRLGPSMRIFNEILVKISASIKGNI